MNTRTVEARGIGCPWSWSSKPLWATRPFAVAEIWTWVLCQDREPSLQPLTCLLTLPVIHGVADSVSCFPLMVTGFVFSVYFTCVYASVGAGAQEGQNGVFDPPELQVNAKRCVFWEPNCFLTQQLPYWRRPRVLGQRINVNTQTTEALAGSSLPVTVWWSLQTTVNDSVFLVMPASSFASLPTLFKHVTT